ncbi:TPA: EamA family transporter [Vibrio vulnificus]|uniref:DMT family transporter n=1 Tax=Vibrio vulnificus TaxID=672 RepID=UPI000A20B998|nr:EamA family transporter [Vibrio vulnificus]ARN68911.1 Permease of the drug/metabolite transporter (DMT) superfamily [Vibrio vulnificus]EGQ9880452.1 EamA family transporter [Vibrio vulnificus]EHZ7341424.1 EamA family transporter [Vibrio vulnificus]EID4421960.1 EamA family transporter [Vibrio vulnificus]ELE1958757.1 EamA family transporter [Vibrio vulnificus]
MTELALASSITSKTKGRGAILLACVLWGTTGTAASLTQSVSPLAIGAFAMGVGGLLQAFLARRAIVYQCRILLEFKRPLLISAVALAVYPLAFYTSMQLAGVAVGTVISIASAPFFTVMLERLFGQGVNISRRWWLSFAIGVLGITLLATAKAPLHGESGANYMLGILLGFAGGLAYAIYSWVAKAMILQGVKSQAAVGAIFALGASLLLPSLAWTGDQLFATSLNTGVAIYMALLPMCVGYLLFGFGLRYVEVHSANLLTLFEPVIASLLAVWVVGESISPLGWLGITLIGGCLVMQSRSAEPT